MYGRDKTQGAIASPMARTPKLRCFSMIVATLVLYFASGAVVAITRYVDQATGADNGFCNITPCQSITYAISTAVTGDIVKIAAGTYQESNIVVGVDLTIVGDGSDVTIIDALNAGRIFDVGIVDLMITDIALLNGDADIGNGGAIEFSGNLTLENTRLEGNLAVSGGAIAGTYWSEGDLIVYASTLEYNQASDDGGAIWCDGCGLVKVRDSVVFYNHSGRNGGAIYIKGVYGFAGQWVNLFTPLLIVNSSDLTLNTASSGGGIYAYDSDVKIRESELADNVAETSAGGIYFNHFTAGNLNVKRSTLANNGTDGIGGGLWATGSGVVTVGNSTFSGNTADCAGGVIITSSITATFSNLTFIDNVGTQVNCGQQIDFDAFTATLVLANSILERGLDQPPAGATACNTALTDGSHNRIYDSSCDNAVALFNLGAVTFLDHTLADNGGPTRTHKPIWRLDTMLPMVSNAIDTGDNSICVMGQDQRGGPRQVDHVPMLVGGVATCDIGAVELRTAE